MRALACMFQYVSVYTCVNVCDVFMYEYRYMNVSGHVWSAGLRRGGIGNVYE